MHDPQHIDSGAEIGEWMRAGTLVGTGLGVGLMLLAFVQESMSKHEVPHYLDLLYPLVMAVVFGGGLGLLGGLVMGLTAPIVENRGERIITAVIMGALCGLLLGVIGAVLGGIAGGYTTTLVERRQRRRRH